MRKDDSPLCVQSKQFALKIIGLYRALSEGRHEFVLSKQILRSGTSIGANVREALQAQSLLDFISKLSIALKETTETGYWLELLVESGMVAPEDGRPLLADLTGIERMLTSSIKTSKSRLN